MSKVNDNLVYLENICKDFSLPCSIDIKLGRHMYGFDTDTAKKAERDNKSKSSTSWEHYIRLTGDVINTPEEKITHD